MANLEDGVKGTELELPGAADGDSTDDSIKGGHRNTTYDLSIHSLTYKVSLMLLAGESSVYVYGRIDMSHVPSFISRPFHESWSRPLERGQLPCATCSADNFLCQECHHFPLSFHILTDFEQF
jgi:hypothetical protein